MIRVSPIPCTVHVLLRASSARAAAVVLRNTTAGCQTVPCGSLSALGRSAYFLVPRYEILAHDFTSDAALGACIEPLTQIDRVPAVKASDERVGRDAGTLQPLIKPPSTQCRPAWSAGRHRDAHCTVYVALACRRMRTLLQSQSISLQMLMLLSPPRTPALGCKGTGMPTALNSAKQEGGNRRQIGSSL